MPEVIKSRTAARSLSLEPRSCIGGIRIMKKLLLIIVLAAACLGLLAAPALAAYPVDGVPGAAYVHPWAGTDPIWWEEVNEDGSLSTYSVSPPEPGSFQEQWAPYKPITDDHTIYFAGWQTGWPKLQVALWPATTRLDCVLYNPDGSTRWSIDAKQARKHWGPVLYMWDAPTIFQESAKIWGIGWMYRLGKLPHGTYSGSGNWVFLTPYLNFEPPTADPNKPDVIPASVWNAWNPYTYSFEVFEAAD